MSSEDLKKRHIRTQGKYSDPDLMKIRDKKKISPKEKNENKVSKRYSNERRKSDEHSSVKYEENSSFSFTELEEQKKPIEIFSSGKHHISKTELGESLIYYHTDFFDEEEAWDLFHYFESSTAWNSKNIVIRGEEFPQPRLVAWYGPYPYSYSGTTLEAAEMPETVIKIKEKIEAYLKAQDIKVEFNSVLLNMYRDERDSVAWHSDDELTLGICPTIASISLGEVRKFEIRPKKRYGEEHHLESSPMFMNLCHGSLVVMDGCMQEDWEHRIPKEYHEKGTRINLTFRTVFDIDKILPKKQPKQYAAASNSTKTNSGRAVEFNDSNFPALNSDVKTNGKLSRLSEFRSNDVACNNNDDDENCEEGEIVEDKISGDDSIDGTALMLPNDTGDELYNKLPDGRERLQGREAPFRQVAKRNNGFSRNQNLIGRGSTRNWNHVDRANKQLDKKGEGRQDEDRRWKSDQNEERRWSPQSRMNEVENEERKLSSRGRMNEDKIGDRREIPRGRMNDDEIEDRRWSPRGRINEDKIEEKGWSPRGRINEDKIEDRREIPRGRMNDDEIEDRRWSPRGRINEDKIEDRRWSPRGRMNEDKIEDRREIPRGRMNEDEIEDRREIPRAHDYPMRQMRQNGNAISQRIRQNDNARQGNFSNLQNDERQGRNYQARNDDHRYHGRLPQAREYDRSHGRVPQRQNGDRRNENRNYLPPPKYSNNNRYQPKYRVEDEALSEQPFDNDKHASELVREEHRGSNHNKEHSNSILNVAANEFVPKSQTRDLNFDRMSLEDLLDQENNIKSMNDYNLQRYAENLKRRVLEILDEFKPDVKEDLELLCTITDGSQSTKNQQLISCRIASIAFVHTIRRSASRRHRY